MIASTRRGLRAESRGALFCVSYPSRSKPLEAGMWIVRLALRRPYTFVVLSILILLLGIGSAIETPKDIFPYINIPVATIVWTYSGLPPTEMEGRIVTICERALTTTVNDIEHTESESYQGVSVHPRVFSAAGEDRARAVADHVDRADRVAKVSAGDVSAGDHQVRRVVSANSAARNERRQPDGKRSVRRWPELYSPAPGDGEGCLRSAALMAAKSDR